MRLLTLNCHSWIEDNQLEKIKHIAETIKENQYDVIALQEVSQLIESEKIDANIKKDNFAKVLIDELNALDEYGYSFIWDYSHIGYDLYVEGLALLTKHPIVDSKSFYVSKSDDKTNYKSRNIVAATINIDGELIDFYSCHLGWWHDEVEPFKYQADKLIEQVKDDKLAFIMGDFNNNAFVRNEGYDYLIEKGFIDTYSSAKEKDNGITVKGEIAGWESENSNKRLDIIFSNRKVEVLESKVIFNELNRKVVSDHSGVEILI